LEESRFLDKKIDKYFEKMIERVNTL